MIYIFDFFTYMLDLIAWACLIRFFLCPSIKFNKNFWIYVFFSAAIQVVFTYYDVVEFILFLLILHPLVILLLASESNKFKKFIGSVIILQFICIPVNILLLFTNGLKLSFLESEYIIEVICIISDIIIIFLYHQASKKILMKIEFTKSEIAFCTLLNLSTFITVVAVDPASGIISAANGPNHLRMMLISIVILLNLFYCVVLYKNKTNFYYKHLNKINQQYIIDELKYFEVYKTSQMELRRFKHDMKNHFLCLETLCEEQKFLEVQSYVSALFEKLQQTELLYHIGNDITDAIINGKIVFIKKEHIAFEIDGRFIGELQLTPIDLCTIFSNAIDNAMEANLKIQEYQDRYLHISIKNNENFYMITFINPATHPIMIKNSMMVTDKKDAHNHGFGLANIKAAAERNKGYINISSNNSEFILEVVIPR